MLKKVKRIGVLITVISGLLAIKSFAQTVTMDTLTGEVTKNLEIVKTAGSAWADWFFAFSLVVAVVLGVWAGVKKDKGGIGYYVGVIFLIIIAGVIVKMVWA